MGSHFPLKVPSEYRNGGFILGGIKISPKAFVAPLPCPLGSYKAPTGGWSVNGVVVGQGGGVRVQVSFGAIEKQYKQKGYASPKQSQAGKMTAVQL